MSKFTKDEQTDIVKQAMELETAIQKGQKELFQLKQEKFKAAPDEPVRKVINQNVKPVAPDYSALPKANYTFAAFLEDDIKTKPTLLKKLFSAHPFKRALIVCVICSILGLVLGIFSIKIQLMFLVALILELIASFVFPAAVIYWIVKRSEYTSKKKWLAVQLTQTPAYIQAKTEAERIAQQKQAAIVEDLRTQQANLDSQYAREKEHYDTVVLPQYKAELSAWTAEHDKKVRAVADKLEADRKAQSELYQASKIIPMQYSSIDALTYIYQLMSTSEYDLKEAIAMYDKEIQRQQEEAKIAEQQRANDLADEQNYHLSQQNDLLAEQNDLEKKSLKHQKIADLVGVVQNHNRNKYLKNGK